MRKKIVVLLFGIVTSMLLTACGNSQSENSPSKSGHTEETENSDITENDIWEADGDEVYDGLTFEEIKPVIEALYMSDYVFSEDTADIRSQILESIDTDKITLLGDFDGTPAGSQYDYLQFDDSFIGDDYYYPDYYTLEIECELINISTETAYAVRDYLAENGFTGTIDGSHYVFSCPYDVENDQKTSSLSVSHHSISIRRTVFSSRQTVGSSEDDYSQGIPFDYSGFAVYDVVDMRTLDENEYPDYISYREPNDTWTAENQSSFNGLLPEDVASVTISGKTVDFECISGFSTVEEVAGWLADVNSMLGILYDEDGLETYGNSADTFLSYLQDSAFDNTGHAIISFGGHDCDDNASAESPDSDYGKLQIDLYKDYQDGHWVITDIYITVDGSSLWSDNGIERWQAEEIVLLNIKSDEVSVPMYTDYSQSNLSETYWEGTFLTDAAIVID